MKAVQLAVVFVLALCALKCYAQPCGSAGAVGTCRRRDEAAVSSCPGGWLPGLCPGAANLQCCIQHSSSPCNSSGFVRGVCQYTEQHCAGTYISGLCSGPSNVKCCANGWSTNKSAAAFSEPNVGQRCAVGSAAGICKQTTSHCSGQLVSGVCAGPSNVKCCIQTTVTPPWPASPPSSAPLVKRGGRRVRGLYAVRPLKSSRYYLEGASGSLPFKAYSKARLSSVSVTVNGRSVGASARPCGGYNWCFSIDFRRIHGTSTVAVRSNLGEIARYTIPLLRVPSWLLYLLGRSSSSQLGSPYSFRRSVGRSYTANRHVIDAKVPFFGFKFESKFSVSYAASLTTTSASLSGSGHMSLRLDPDCCSYSSANFGGGLGADMTMVRIGTGLYTVRFSKVWVSVTGGVGFPGFSPPLPSFKVGPVRFGMKLGLTVGLSSDLRLYLSASGSSRLFGVLPVRFSHLQGGVYGSATITARVSGGVAGVGLSAAATVGPRLGWDGKGIHFRGLYVSATVSAHADVWIHTFTRTLLSYSRTFWGKRQDNGTALPEEFQLIDSAPALLRNIWNPRVTSQGAPFVVENLYPGNFVSVASTGGRRELGTSDNRLDVAVWTSFDPALPARRDMQVQYVWRTSSSADGDYWSAPAFVPASHGPVATPVIEDLELVEGVPVLLVAAELLTHHQSVDAMRAQLVFAQFNVTSYTWTPYASVFPTQPPNVSLDWMPALSEDGMLLVFQRVYSDNSTSLFSSEYQPESSTWSEPLSVPFDGPVRSLVLDRDSETGNALVLLTLDDGEHTGGGVQLCTQQQHRWMCPQSSMLQLDSFAAPALQFAPQIGQYALVWANNNTLYTQLISEDAMLLDSHTLALNGTPTSISATLCELAGEGTLVVGWAELNPLTNRSVLSYALMDSQGQLLYSPTGHSRNASWVAPRLPIRSANRVFAPNALELLWNGDTLIYASLLSEVPSLDENFTSSTNRNGTLLLEDINFESAASLSPVQLTADEAGGVSLATVLSNNGLRSLPAGGLIEFSLRCNSVLDNDITTTLGSLNISESLRPSATVPVQLLWNRGADLSCVNKNAIASLVARYFASEAGFVSSASAPVDAFALNVWSVTLASDARGRFVAQTTLHVTGVPSGQLIVRAYTNSVLLGELRNVALSPDIALYSLQIPLDLSRVTVTAPERNTEIDVYDTDPDFGSDVETTEPNLVDDEQDATENSTSAVPIQLEILSSTSRWIFDVSLDDNRFVDLSFDPPEALSYDWVGAGQLLVTLPIHNEGSAYAPHVPVGALVNGVLAFSLDSDAVAPGATVNVSFVLQFNETGDYAVVIDLNSAQAAAVLSTTVLAETNSLNNRFEFALEVLPQHLAMFRAIDETAEHKQARDSLVVIVAVVVCVMLVAVAVAAVGLVLWKRKSAKKGAELYYQLRASQE